MTPPPEKPPLSLDELLAAWKIDQWVFDRAVPVGEEMAARLRLIDGLHQQEPSGEDYEAECMACEEIWPCSTRCALAGERTDGP